MTRFMTTTATALVLGTAAYADNHTSAFSDMTFDAEVNLNASELIGARVYATETEIANDAAIEADGEQEWDDIGEINEIVLTRSGEVESVIVGVGGFIGIGEKDVAVDMSQIKFVKDGEEADDYFLVINANAAGIEDAPAYERDPMTEDGEAMADNGEAKADDGEAMAEESEAMAEDGEAMTEENEAMAEERPMLTPPTVDREGYASVERNDLTTEDLTGARVYGTGDEDVGEISELILTDDGQIDRAVIDVGGFLGMGEHSVAVTLDELEIVRAENGDSLRVYIDSSQEALEQQPEYEG